RQTIKDMSDKDLDKFLEIYNSNKTESVEFYNWKISTGLSFEDIRNENQ
ncbi:14632_t:CDS:1, partial [Racocetra persica]